MILREDMQFLRWGIEFQLREHHLMVNINYITIVDQPNKFIPVFTVKEDEFDTQNCSSDFIATDWTTRLLTRESEN